MAEIGKGYGSEWHLLRYLGRHRNALNRAILKSIGKGRQIDWVDFGFRPDPNGKCADTEWKGLDMLPEDQFPALHPAWKEFWPHSGNPHNWDAVGWLLHESKAPELLLVEAKAHTGELKSDCGATDPDSIERIGRAFHEAKKVLNINQDIDWTRGYYQHANRVATLMFLHERNIPARLIFIYFYGDKRQTAGINCPESPSDWKLALDDQSTTLGLASQGSSPGRTHPIIGRIHDVFLSVNG